MPLWAYRAFCLLQTRGKAEKAASAANFFDKMPKCLLCPDVQRRAAVNKKAKAKAAQRFAAGLGTAEATNCKADNISRREEKAG